MHSLHRKALLACLSYQRHFSEAGEQILSSNDGLRVKGSYYTFFALEGIARLSKLSATFFRSW